MSLEGNSCQEKKSGGCKKYTKITLSSREEKHVDMYNGYDYY